MRAAVLFIVLLAGCADETDNRLNEKQRHLMMIVEHAPAADLCADDRRNADHALDRLDRTEYRFWLAQSKEDCHQT